MISVKCQKKRAFFDIMAEIYLIFSIPKSLQIFTAKWSEISVCLGTALLL